MERAVVHNNENPCVFRERRGFGCAVSLVCGQTKPNSQKQHANPGLPKSSSSSESRGFMVYGKIRSAPRRVRNIADPSPVNTRKISSLPSSMPAISANGVAARVSGPVSPMDRPTVPSEDANSNMQLASGACASRGGCRGMGFVAASGRRMPYRKCFLRK